MKKNIISLLVLLLIAFNALAEEIVVLYDNDVHCAVNGYSKMGALRDEMAKNHKYVTTVSSGDFIQGDIIGANSKGDAIVTIMNSVGYDIVTLGNHEFDYGVPQLMELS
ncbi:MAG: bifunctional metallophosphatase/5'-nucleotidase, partial [bacterium]|nr:bifunctional metallophosphatase/5'-nucleotidase [Candidatus Colousia faecequi]